MEKCFDFYIKYGEADSAIPNFIKEFGFNFGSAVRKSFHNIYPQQQNQ